MITNVFELKEFLLSHLEDNLGTIEDSQGRSYPGIVISASYDPNLKYSGVICKIKPMPNGDPVSVVGGSYYDLEFVIEFEIREFKREKQLLDIYDILQRLVRPIRSSFVPENQMINNYPKLIMFIKRSFLEPLNQSSDLQNL